MNARTLEVSQATNGAACGSERIIQAVELVGGVARQVADAMREQLAAGDTLAMTAASVGATSAVLRLQSRTLASAVTAFETRAFEGA